MDEAKALREATKAKLQNATAKREGERLSWLSRLQQATNEKLAKGKASLEESERKSKELEATLEQKIVAAEIRREESIKKNVLELASKNEEKFQRGKVALALADADSRRLESDIEHKIVNANLRKEMKIKETIQHISSKTEAKMVQGQVALSSQNHLAKKTMQNSLKKQDAALKKREGLVLGQVELLQKSATKKEQRVVEKQMQDEESAKALQKSLSAKLITADLARDELLNAKVNKAVANDLARTEKAKAAAYKDLKLQKGLAEMAQDRMLKAEARKEKLQKEKIEAASSSKKKVVVPSPRGSPDPALDVVKIEEKLNSAAKRRDNFLAARASSSSKRVHSPRELSGSLTMDDITTKLNSAAERREIYLKNKVSPFRSRNDAEETQVSKNLSFSSISPSSSPSGAHSPRIKAARLEAKTKCSNENNDPLPPYLSPWLLSSFAFALLGMMAFARFSSTK